MYQKYHAACKSATCYMYALYKSNNQMRIPFRRRAIAINLIH